MKIVISGYIGKKITGIGRNLISLLNETDNTNQYIIYTNRDMAADFGFTKNNITVKTYNISKNDSFKNLLWTTFVFPIVVLKEKADRALIPNFNLLLFKFRPTIVIMHDLIEFNVRNKFSKKKMFYRTKLADPITAKKADHIITVSNNSKEDIVRFLNVDENKVTVIYNGVDQKIFSKMDHSAATYLLSKRNWPAKFILYAGTVDHPGKNAMGVIKAFELLKRCQEYSGSLVIAGMPGAGYEIIEKYVQGSEYKEDIILTGFVEDNELVALYSECEVFCFVSLYEGFGIPPLEALACGAKIVVSNTSSLPEVVGNVGITVSPTDIEEISNKIFESLHRVEYSSETVKRHLENYSWHNLSKKFEEVICSE